MTYRPPSPFNPSGLLDHTIHAQPWMFFGGGQLPRLYRGTGVAGASGPPLGAGYGGYLGLPGGGYGGGYGSLPPGYQTVQNDLNAANAANEARYSQLLGLSDSGKSEELNALRGGYAALLGLAGQGQSQARADEQQRLKQDMGAAQAQATARGLGNTTILNSLQRGAQDESSRRMMGLDDVLTSQKLGIGQNYYRQLLNATQDANSRKMGIIERRTDAGPDLGLYAQLLSRPGAAGYGGGYGGGFNPGFFPSLYGGGAGGAPQVFGGGLRNPAPQLSPPRPSRIGPVRRMPAPDAYGNYTGNLPGGNKFTYQI